MLLEKGINLFSNGTAIERFALGSSDFFQCLSHIRAAEHLAGFEPSVVGSECIEPALEFRTITIFGIVFESFLPETGNIRGHRIAFFGVANGRSHYFFQRKFAESFMKRHPAGNRTRNINRFDTVGRDLFESSVF